MKGMHILVVKMRCISNTRKCWYPYIIMPLRGSKYFNKDNNV